MSDGSNGARRTRRRAGPGGPQLLLVAIGLVLSACAGDVAPRGEALRLVGNDIPRGIVHEAYDGTFHAVGGLRPYTFSITSGALPAGITLQNGVLRGIPTEVGTFALTVEVSDANLSRVSQKYTLQVTSPPPTRFVLDAPQTEVRGGVTVRAKLEEARAVTGVRSLVTWNPEVFRLADGGPVAGRPGVALFWRAEAGELQVDLAPLGKSLDGSVELYRFTLVPVAPPVRVQASYAAEVLSTSLDPERQHEYLSGVVGAAPRPRPETSLEEPGDQSRPPDTHGEEGDQ
ncbi:MAG: Ig domain-containing protein [Trueperaceae bacterium]